VASYSDSLQLIVLELIRKVVRSAPLDKSKYIRCILTLFNSPSNAVTYEVRNPCKLNLSRKGLDMRRPFSI